MQVEHCWAYKYTAPILQTKFKFELYLEFLSQAFPVSKSSKVDKFRNLGPVSLKEYYISRNNNPNDVT